MNSHKNIQNHPPQGDARSTRKTAWRCFFASCVCLIALLGNFTFAPLLVSAVVPLDSVASIQIIYQKYESDTFLDGSVDYSSRRYAAKPDIQRIYDILDSTAMVRNIFKPMPVTFTTPSTWEHLTVCIYYSSDSKSPDARYDTFSVFAAHEYNYNQIIDSYTTTISKSAYDSSSYRFKTPAKAIYDGLLELYNEGGGDVVTDFNMVMEDNINA